MFKVSLSPDASSDGVEGALAAEVVDSALPVGSSQTGRTATDMNHLRNGFQDEGLVVNLFTLGVKHLLQLPQAAGTKALVEW